MGCLKPHSGPLSPFKHALKHALKKPRKNSQQVYKFIEHKLRIRRPTTCLGMELGGEERFRFMF